MTSHKRTSAASRNASEMPLQNINSELAERPPDGTQGDFEDKLEQTLRLFKLKAARQIAYELPRITAKVLEDASDEFRRRATETAEALRGELHRSGEQLASDIRAQLAALTGDCASAFGADLKAAAEAALNNAKSSIDESVQLASQTAAETSERIVSGLRQSGAALLQDAEQQLRKLGEASSGEWREIAAAAAERAASEAVRNVEEQAQSAIAHSASAALARLEAEQQKFQSQAELNLDSIQTRLMEFSARGAEDLQSQLDGHLEDFRARLSDSVEAMKQKAVEDAAQEFPRVSAGLIEKAEAEVQNKTRGAAEKAKEEVRASVSGIAGDLGRQLVQQTEGDLSALRESTIEQSRSQLCQALKDAAAESRKETEKDIGESIRKIRSSAQAQIDEISRASMERLRAASAGIAPGPARGSLAGKVVLALVALLPTVLFAYLMSRPVMRLKVDPPAEFVNAYPEWTGAHQAEAARLAAAYWDWAALHLADSYPYGSQLPEQPPMSFAVEGKGFPSGVDADVARMRYWQKLRDLWTNPQSWQKIERWNLH